MGILQQLPDAKNTEAIIFDLGGVIINIDYHRTKNAFELLGIKNFDQLFSKASQSQLFDKLEKGEISDAEFYSTIREISRLNLSDKEIRDAWNAILLDFPVRRMERLMELKNKYRIFLLSNTNRIHINAFTELLISRFGENLLPKIFENIYYSSEIGMRKPDAEIFEFVISENRLDKAKTFFIDDSPQHITGAAKIGLPSYHLKDGQDMLELLIDF